MSKAQSDGIIGSRIKTWLPGRQKAMISWTASKVMWEKYVGLAVCWSPETSTVGWIAAKENSPSRTPASAFLNTSRARTETSHKKNHGFLP